AGAAGGGGVVGELARVLLDPGEQVVERLRRFRHHGAVVGEQHRGGAVGDADALARGEDRVVHVRQPGDDVRADLEQHTRLGRAGDDEAGVDEVEARVVTRLGGGDELGDGLLVVLAVQVEHDVDL